MLKKQILWFHKWLGLLSGIIVFIVSITGCIYVFHDELKLQVYPEKYFTNTDSTLNRTPLPLSVLQADAQLALPKGEKISRVDLFPAKDRTWVFRASKTNENAVGHWAYYTYYKRVFVNPYTGEVQAVEDSKNEFFQLVLQLHMNLLLGKKVGSLVVGTATALFAVILLTGLVLWWPKKWKGKTLKRSFRFDFKVNRKRLNYDLHNILGIYALCFALLFALTGLVFAFPAVKKIYVNGFNSFSTVSSPTHDFGKIPFTPNRDNLLDTALNYALSQHPTADMMAIRFKPKEAIQDIQVRLNKDRSGVFVWYYFDKETGGIQNIKRSHSQPWGDRLSSMNYDLHVGSYGGIYTKIITFIMALVCASLPLTGFIIWLNKGKKKGKKKKLC